MTRSPHSLFVIPLALAIVLQARCAYSAEANFQTYGVDVIGIQLEACDQSKGFKSLRAEAKCLRALAQGSTDSQAGLGNPDVKLIVMTAENLADEVAHGPVSYTHLTLPTKRIV